ncbi:MAG: hypothetical protein HC902_04985 [Calothrix sp. SM1_5_4]|nr:hypothetical protein [Calothrix sp. SM1_5_4]
MLSASVNLTWVRDTAAPVFASGQFLINGGGGATANPQVTISFRATDVNNITEFCLKTSDASAPGAADACWNAVNAPSPGLAPSPNLVLNNMTYSLPSADGVYYVYGWVKDVAGNISSLAGSGVGVDGQDRDWISVDQGSPPAISNLIASRSDSAQPPFAAGDTTVTAGEAIYIKWTVTDDAPLPAQPLRLFFTTDDTNFTEISGGQIANSAHGSCTLSGSATGCYVFTSPTSGFIRIRLQAADELARLTVRVSNSLNTSPIRILAGDTNTGEGGSAKRAVFLPDFGMSSSTPWSNLFVIDRKGDVYFLDHQRGILKIDAVTGILSVFLRRSSGSTGDGGPVSAATVRYPWKINIDPQDRLILYDYNRIRRINTDLANPTIEALIGGSTPTLADDTIDYPCRHP